MSTAITKICYSAGVDIANLLTGAGRAGRQLHALGGRQRVPGHLVHREQAQLGGPGVVPGRNQLLQLQSAHYGDERG